MNLPSRPREQGRRPPRTPRTQRGAAVVQSLCPGPWATATALLGLEGVSGDLGRGSISAWTTGLASARPAQPQGAVTPGALALEAQAGGKGPLDPEQESLWGSQGSFGSLGSRM